MYLTSLIVAAATLAISGVESNPVPKAKYKYVAAFSVDGFHGSDVEKYIKARPESTIAKLLQTGYEYTSAYTSAPSDSFPGTLNQFTGASPKTTGVWYDDAYDREFFAPSSGCKGPPGAEVEYTEALDYDPTKVFSGGINPAKLPQKIVNGVCTNIYPHARLRVNTVFEIARAAGLTTAYTDKHPAYDLVRGPSGTGLSLGYFPEIAANPTQIDPTIKYDGLHVDAFLDWIKGVDPANSEGTLGGKTPNLFGGNFQSINVAQKVAGYQAAPGFPFTPAMLSTYDFVDQSLGKIVQALKDKKIYEDTLIIIASKHGQAPIDPTQFKKINPALVTNATGVDVLFQVSDDIVLLWLANHEDTEKAVANFNKNAKALEIKDIIYGERLRQRYGNPLTDPAVPDILVNPHNGIIYTNSNSKMAEHGGIHEEDRHVACFVSNPKLKKRKISERTSTKQVAVTILQALGLDDEKLQGAEIERTRALEGFDD